MYIGLSIVSVYLLLLPYYSANKDHRKTAYCVDYSRHVFDKNISDKASRLLLLSWQQWPEFSVHEKTGMSRRPPTTTGEKGEITAASLTHSVRSPGQLHERSIRRAVRRLTASIRRIMSRRGGGATLHARRQ